MFNAMSNSNISNSQITSDLPFDQRLMLFLNAIRRDAFDAQLNTPSDAESVSSFPDTLLVVAEATMELATRERLLAEKDTFKAEMEKIQAETERIKAETEKIRAEKM